MSVIDDSNDPLDKYRKIVSSSATEGDGSEIYRSCVGTWIRFGKTQEIRWSIIGNNAPEYICAETFDLVDGVWVSKRILNYFTHELPQLMDDLLSAEHQADEMSTQPKDSWTPITISSTPSDTTSQGVKVVVDPYNGKINVKLTRSGSSKGRQWLVTSPSDIKELMIWLLKSADQLKAAVAGEPKPKSGYDEPIPF